jgi:hypothetical protein
MYKTLALPEKHGQVVYRILIVPGSFFRLPLVYLVISDKAQSFLACCGLPCKIYTLALPEKIQLSCI